MFDTTYLIVPDVVAHDKDLLPLDKLLLGLIYSLTKQMVIVGHQINI